ncbi:MAG: glycoside hydrolase family 9 protein [Oscillospiraceae bacterium]|nr:glycoside hydrolase family 9 protein [Oscillospiraceae bacterium]
MLTSKLGKKLAASAVAIAMTASASAASLASLTAYAGVMTGEGTFEEGAGLPWHVCENGTGQMAFNINDGVYSILIKNPGGASNGGDDRWDCQFRHRGMSIKYGNTYRITYSVYATNSGKLYPKIGDITNDNAEYWHGNGNKLGLEYKEDMSMDELASALKSATPSKTIDSNQSQWDVPYYEGWNSWKNIEIPAKKWTTFSYEFIIDDSYMENVKQEGTTPTGEGTVEWTFHFGGDGQFTDKAMFPEGTILKFDNMMLMDMSGDSNDYKAEEKPEKKGLMLNQLGFYPKTIKQATIETTSAVDWKITGPETLSGTSSTPKKDSGSWESAAVIDFSELKTPGKYTLTAGGKSVDFEIKEDLYGDLLRDSFNYYYLNRSGIAIEDSYIANGGKNKSKSALTRDAGHPKDMAYVTDEWVFLYEERTNTEIKGRYSKQIDCTGGWYDAGDYGKYVVNGGVSMWTLANAYERNPEKFAEGKATTQKLPETGNGTPDILDELKWEADFFINMTRDDGFVYHKMHDYKWTALGVMPYLEEDADEDVTMPTRIVKPVTYAATLNSAAALAQLSRLLEKAGDKDASKYLEYAEKSYKAAKDDYEKKYGSIYKQASDATDLGTPLTDPSKFAPLDQNKGGGPYGDTQVTDEFYWAACELYVTTGDKSYYDDLKGSDDFAFKVITDLVGGENKGSPTTFTWGTLSSLGTASLALHQDLLDAAEAKEVVNQFQAAGDTYLKYEGESMYGSPYPGHTYDTSVTDIIGDTASERSITLEGGYEWGSNSMVINNAMILGMAYDLTEDPKYCNGVITAMDYIFGRNAIENSYVTGYGNEGTTTANPHHRYWCHQMKPDWPSAPDGCLSGGPNSDMNDPMIQGAGYKIGELAPMKCYYDNCDAWSVNEITINWNAPLVWISSFVEDEAPNIGESTQNPTDPKPTDEPTDQPGDKVYGDVDCNGKVDIIDVITLNKNLMVGEQLKPQGKINADVDDNSIVDEIDSLNILKYVVEILESFPVK